MIRTSAIRTSVIRSSTIRLAAAALLSLAAACSSEGKRAAHSEGQLMPIDHPGLERESTRLPRRLSHLQLRRSVESLLGTRWVEDNLDMFFVLGPTLGDPDYQEITVENLDPSPLYVKFMEDMASTVCRDAPMTALAPKATVEENVSALKLRLHGEYLPPGDPGLAPLVDLAKTTDLRAVCVSLLAAPEFYLY